MVQSERAFVLYNSANICSPASRASEISILRTMIKIIRAHLLSNKHFQPCTFYYNTQSTKISIKNNINRLSTIFSF